MANSKPSIGPRRSRKIWVVLASVIIIAVVIAGVFYMANRSQAAPAPPTGPHVPIRDTGFCSNTGNCGYSLIDQNITSGTALTALTWTNTGGLPHTASECTKADTTNA